MSQHDQIKRSILQEPDNPRKAVDGVLIQRCLQRDDQAWGALLDRYGSLIYSISLRFDLSLQERSDVFQSVCLKVLEELERLRQETTIRPWVTTLTLWQCQKLMAREQSGEQPLSFSDQSRRLNQEIRQMEQECLVKQALAVLEKPSQRLLQALFHEQEPWGDEGIKSDSEVSDSTGTRPLDEELSRFMSILSELGFST